MDVRVGLQRKLSAKELMFWTVVLEKTLESPLDCKEIQPVNPKGNQSWIFIGRTDGSWNSNTLATWWTDSSVLEFLGPRHWCWERLKAVGEGDDRGWNDWMTSATWWIWVWASSRNWWWTGKPGVLQSMGSQRVGYNWETELNWVLHLPSILDYGACPYVFCFNHNSIKSSLIFPTIVICITFPLSHGSILLMLGKWKVQ